MFELANTPRLVTAVSYACLVDQRMTQKYHISHITKFRSQRLPSEFSGFSFHRQCDPLPGKQTRRTESSFFPSPVRFLDGYLQRIASSPHRAPSVRSSTPHDGCSFPSSSQDCTLSRIWMQTGSVLSCSLLCSSHCGRSWAAGMNV